MAQTVKHLPTMWVDLGLIPGSGRSSGEGNGNPLQYSCLEYPMDGWSLVGYSLWGHEESDMIYRCSLTHPKLNAFLSFLYL